MTCALLFTALTLAALIQVLHFPMINDAPLLNYSGKAILAGKAPYRDFFDMNFPGALLIHAALMALPLPPEAATQYSNCILLIIAAGMTGRMVWLVSRSLPIAALAAAGATLAVIMQGAPNMLQRDFFVAMFSIGAMLLTLEEDLRQKPLPWVRGAGFLLMAFATTIKPQSILLASGILLPTRNTPQRSVLARVVYFLGALAFVWTCVGLWLAHLGAWRSFISFVCGYTLPVYSKLNWATDATSLTILLDELALISNNILSPISLLIGSTIVILLGEVRGPFFRILLGAASAYCYFLLQFKGWYYHAIPFSYFAFIAFGGALGVAKTLATGWGPAGAFILVFETAITGYCSVRELRAERWDSLKEHVDSLEHDLAPEVRKGRTVQFFDVASMGGANALLKLGAIAPTRLIYDFMLFRPYSPGHRPTAYESSVSRAILDDILTVKPDIFAINRSGFSSPQPERWLAIPELAQLITSDYTLAIDRERYLIFRKRNLD